ncbi:cystathionine beta-lyase [Roseospira visakhapatnamensis]|uniref:Cystathionine beta-lyase n=1 Tax=Roseospira visakhapatnamensis TaxID=390880 RepID=A0A7W6RFG8_9PROT|nr:cystathionine beta-lyase [Roseospira visakhapatnamensis]MBB4267457.1 cystathionine beta-lyase [Roseospira visakhapatnamensis]
MTDPTVGPEAVSHARDTRIVHAGHRPTDHHGAVNPPVYHVSTITFPTVDDMAAKQAHKLDAVYYGRMGTPTTQSLDQTVAELEGGHWCVSVCSGMAAVTGALMALLKAGDHMLMTDSVYWPSRSLCDTLLCNMGIKTTYYDPQIDGPGLTALMRPNTRVVFLESPGSLTFETQDVAALAAAAHAGGAHVLLDNTWASPILFRPFDHGVDLSIQAATKYIVGHSDAMLGTVTMRDRALFERVKTTAVQLGYSVGAEEAYLGLRGLRTLAVRLRQHQANGLAVARWLQGRPEVARVLHPALPEDPGHALWRRDFSGACGLFGVLLRPGPSPDAMAAFLDGLALFRMGFSWGGYESLVIDTTRSITRTAAPWTHDGPSLRLHVGLEDPADLIADLDAGFARMAARDAS